MKDLGIERNLSMLVIIRPPFVGVILKYLPGSDREQSDCVGDRRDLIAPGSGSG